MRRRACRRCLICGRAAGEAAAAPIPHTPAHRGTSLSSALGHPAHLETRFLCVKAPELRGGATEKRKQRFSREAELEDRRRGFVSLLDLRSCSGDMRSMLICALLLATVRVIYSLIHFLSSPFALLLSVKYIVKTPAAQFSAPLFPEDFRSCPQSQMSHITRLRCLFLCLSFQCCPWRQQRHIWSQVTHGQHVARGPEAAFSPLNPALGVFNRE